jgi:flavin-dependent dehydrogenase
MAYSPTHATPSQCDVLIIGGGPAGSTAAALLAGQGRDVVLLEKDHHPRFHIGESLLPLNVPLLDELGVREDVEKIGLFKYGAEFTSPYHNKSVTFDFAEALDKSFPYSYQVRRSEFDHVLIKNAAKRGARVLEGHRVNGVDTSDKELVVATAQNDHGELSQWQARFLIDASGRDTFLANKLGIKKRNAKHNSAALYGHFEGAKRLSGKAEGNISLFWFDHGWFWFIPLHDGTTSVGAVCWPYYMKSRKTSPTQFLLNTIALSPALSERLSDARLVAPATATGNYSYQARHMAGRNYILLGDAFAFIDPVFSTGVYLAMNSAFVGAAAVATCLDRPQQAAGALRRFEHQVRGGLESFKWFIYRLTTPSLRDLFVSPKNVFRVQEAVLSLLAGDVFRKKMRLGSKLLVFKFLYYVINLLHLRRSLDAWRRRRRIIRDPQTDSATASRL